MERQFLSHRRSTCQQTVLARVRTEGDCEDQLELGVTSLLP